MIRQEVKIAVSADKITFTIESSNGQSNIPLLSDDYDLSKLHLQIRVSKIFQKVLNIRSTIVKSAIEIFDKDDFVILGDMLSKLLLEHKILNQFFSNIHKVVSESPGIRCRIWIEFDKNVREMAELPWEYIRYENEFLAAHPRTCFDLVRKISLGKDCDERSFQPPGNIKVLVMLADPQTGAYALPEEEKAALRELYKRRQAAAPEQFQYAIVTQINRQNLLEKIKEGREKLEIGNQPYILHFYGHARPDAVALLPLKDNAVEPDWVDDRQFAELFDELYPQEKPVFFAFTACDSGKITQFAENGGVALQLATQQKLLSVLAMQNEVLSSVALAFMDKLYQALLEGADVAEAVSKGRSYLGAKHTYEGRNQNKGAYSNNAFGSPVLFCTTEKDIRFTDPVQAAAKDWIEKLCTRRQKPECQKVEKYPPGETRCRYCSADLLALGPAASGSLESATEKSAATTRT